MKYHTECAYDLYSLEQQVDQQIEKGWEPQGGVSALNDGFGVYYLQAMIKRDEQVRTEIQAQS